MRNKLQTQVFSEIGELEAVIIHTPGSEVENMTPENAEKALYSDILNLDVAVKDYEQLEEALKLHAQVFQVKDLLADIMRNQKVKENLIHKICRNERIYDVCQMLCEMDSNELADTLIEGVIMEKDSLTKYLNKDRYSLKPLHNFFFTRDSAVAIGDEMLIGKMANVVRERESIIMEAIFDYSSFFNTKTINPSNFEGSKEITIEGGDVLVARDNVLCIGLGARTTSQGVDFIVHHFSGLKERYDIIVQELPDKPESFIHLDMVFTFLDYDTCMVYEPLIMGNNRYQTIHITVDNGKTAIRLADNIPAALKNLGYEMKPVYCGGQEDKWIQEREQWHSGANFFALAPGKVVGYGRNVYTMEEMNRNGFEIFTVDEIKNKSIDLTSVPRYVIAIEGSELARGGGGCRCMTMPVRRKLI